MIAGKIRCEHSVPSALKHQGSTFVAFQLLPYMFPGLSTALTLQ
jgi:hypothetical protein